VPLLAYGTVGMLVTALAIGILSVSTSVPVGVGYAILVLICLFIINFAYSWGPVGWIIPAEIFPLAVRGKAISITTCVNWIFNFAVGLVTPPLLSAAGTGAFFLFACFLVCMGAFILLNLPETRGVSLERMEVLFGVVTWQQYKQYAMTNMRHTLSLFGIGTDPIAALNAQKQLQTGENAETGSKQLSTGVELV